MEIVVDDNITSELRELDDEALGRALRIGMDFVDAGAPPESLGQVIDIVREDIEREKQKKENSSSYGRYKKFI